MPSSGCSAAAAAGRSPVPSAGCSRARLAGTSAGAVGSSSRRPPTTQSSRPDSRPTAWPTSGAGSTRPPFTRRTAIALSCAPASGSTDDEPVVLFVGKIMPDKNVMTLARALAALAAEGERFTLLLCGEGAQRREIEALLGRRVVAAGVQRHDTLPWIYASADIFAFPSTSEVYAQVVVEAMCSGLRSGGERTGGRLPACCAPGAGRRRRGRRRSGGVGARPARPAARSAHRRRIGAAARARVESSALDWAAIFDRVVKPCWLAAAGDSRRPSA